MEILPEYLIKRCDHGLQLIGNRLDFADRVIG